MSREEDRAQRRMDRWTPQQWAEFEAECDAAYADGVRQMLAQARLAALEAENSPEQRDWESGQDGPG